MKGSWPKPGCLNPGVGVRVTHQAHTMWRGSSSGSPSELQAKSTGQVTCVAPGIPPSPCIPSTSSSPSARLLQGAFSWHSCSQAWHTRAQAGPGEGSFVLPAGGHRITLVLPDLARVPVGSGPPGHVPSPLPRQPRALAGPPPAASPPPAGALRPAFLRSPSFLFQCYKVSCLEIPGPPGPKGYRGQKVSRPDCPRAPSCQEAPALSQLQTWGPGHLERPQPFRPEELEFSFYPLF